MSYWARAEIAISNDNLDALADAINKDSTLTSQRNIDGQTLLHIASTEGSLEIAKFLCKNGADIEARDDDGATYVHFPLSGC